ncbi:MAG: NADH-quinone oxidoreductase subunit G, partial [Campylobacterales bacterium]
MATMIEITIDGRPIKCEEGAYILDVARANGIYIPAICYLNRCSPTLACRLCLVDIDGKQAYSCNTKAKNGMVVTTNNDEIALERRQIMEVYCINHPLECGVCDKSGECELQNNTLETDVVEQHFAIRDTHRPIRHWDLIKYDSSLCIVCEKCITVCKDMIGDRALKTVPRGGDEISKEVKETTPKNVYAMWNKLNKSIIGSTSADPNTLDCTMCGECIAVCPVGALTSKNFQYTSNAWELTKIPSACAHCAAGCQLYYEVKHTSVQDRTPRIYRVTNESHFQSLCGAGRFGFDFDNSVEGKDEAQFQAALHALNKADTIAFSGYITNEEALLLQKLKESKGYKLVCNDTRPFQKFLRTFSQYAGTTLPQGTLSAIRKSDFIVSVGSRLSNDLPMARFYLNNALTINKGSGLYFHPLNDKVIDSLSKNLLVLNHTIGSEEAVMAALIDLFANKEQLPAHITTMLAAYHRREKVTITRQVKEKIKENVTETITNEDGTTSEVTKEVVKEIEKSISEEVEVDRNGLFELMGLQADLTEKIMPLTEKKSQWTLILGPDLYEHPRAENIARMAGLLQRFSPFKVVLIPPTTNALG